MAEKKMSPYAMFQTDAKLEKDGIILDYGDFKLRIARAGGANRRYERLLEQRTKPIRRALQTDAPGLKRRVEPILREVFAETVVLGWEGVVDRDGNELPFTKENCIKLFEDLPDLFADVQEQATKMSNFRSEALEDEAKN